MDRLYPSGACVMPSSLTFTRTGHEIYGWGYNACPARVKAKEEYNVHNGPTPSGLRWPAVFSNQRNKFASP